MSDTPVSDKLEQMQVKVSAIEEKKLNLEKNFQATRQKIAELQQAIKELEKNALQIAGAIAMCEDLMTTTENPDA